MRPAASPLASAWTASARAVLSRVALGQLIEQRRVERHQRARRDRLAGCVLDDLPPVARRTQRQDPLEERAHVLVAGVVAGADVLLEDLRADVVVELKFDQR